jgi:PTH1 family peptidyl-tRNA hydrolase
VRLRRGGGLAGHNGLRSIAHCLSTREFWRLRIGVGRPQRGDLHNYVLGRFTPEEEAELPAVLETAAAQLVEAVSRGIEGDAG